MTKNDEKGTDESVDQAAAQGTEIAPDNGELQHTEGGSTTKDALDAGVPMLQGEADEPTGPEDALGPGPKRGDYRDRIHTDPHTSELIPEDERVPGGPTSRLVAQAPNAEDIGDVPGEKGGVTTG